MKEKRFETVFKEGTLRGYRIIEDRETGIQYLAYSDGYSGGITVLLNKYGKPANNRKETGEKGFL
ncbi:MAG: DUF6440 family protein [Clostridia bacterium]